MRSGSTARDTELLPPDASGQASARYSAYSVQHRFFR
jgi:hypothetical protein